MPRLGRLLLGLIALQPMSGYDLRKLLHDSPMAAFSDSPGAVYPALARLEREGLVRAVAADAGNRGRRLLQVTPAGRRRLLGWLRSPITDAEVIAHSEDLVLRFSFMSGQIPEAEISAFLRRLQERVDAHLASLIDYRNEQSAQMSPSGRLALGAGIERYRSLAGWARQAAAEFAANGPSMSPVR